jgi:hypothetical protein
MIVPHTPQSFSHQQTGRPPPSFSSCSISYWSGPGEAGGLGRREGRAAERQEMRVAQVRAGEGSVGPTLVVMTAADAGVARHLTEGEGGG